MSNLEQIVRRLASNDGGAFLKDHLLTLVVKVQDKPPHERVADITGQFAAAADNDAPDTTA